MKIILASASPRRRELMNLITCDFTAVSTDADETLPDSIPADASSEYLSQVKARAAVKSFPDDIVIGCDTVVILGDTILGKPRDADQCREYLSMLSGKTHKVITGCTIIYNGNEHSFRQVTDVTFRTLSNEDIECYISTGEPFDKAGGYGIQGKGSLLIESICGDYFNVVGLPVSRLNQELKSIIKI